MAETMNADLRRSGITPHQGKRLGYRELGAAQTKIVTNKHEVKSYKIPYYAPDGTDTGFYRIRFLSPVKPSFGGKATKSIRYWQPPHSLPHVYFPPILQWSTIIKSNDTLYITEGEKKAAKACIAGIPTIGLGGVWSWRSKKEHVDLIDDMQLIEWRDREVGFVFDNDMHKNPKVLQALRALAKELGRKGAKVFVVLLPESDEKIGLDDYLLTHKNLDDLTTEYWEDSYELWELNEELAFIENPASYIHIPTHQHFDSPVKLSQGLYANRTTTVWVDDKPKRINVMKAWSEWPCRRTHSTIVYEPSGTSNGVFNLWKGWGTKPVEGDVTPFLDLIDFLFEDAKQEELDWFLQWLAYPVQFPGTKLMTAVLLHSITQGIGKSLIGHIAGDMYGENFNVIGQDEIHDTYNDWLVGKQFILGEEILGTNKRQDADRIKNMVTREVVGVNRKYVPRFKIRDCVNYMFTSNHPDALFLTKQDRRIFVHEVAKERMSNAFYKRIDKWRRNGGAAHLMHYLMKEVDTSKFDPYAPAPFTDAKKEIVSLSMSDVDDFCDSLVETPEEVLRLGDTVIARDMFTVSELLNIYDPDEKHKTSKIAMSKALRRVGFVRNIVMTDSGTKRLWCVRNVKAWKKRVASEWAAHYNGSLTMLQQPEKKRKF